MTISRSEQIAQLEKEWEQPRWKGITRPYNHYQKSMLRYIAQQHGYSLSCLFLYVHQEAASLMDKITTQDELVDFLTLPGYQLLN